MYEQQQQLQKKIKTNFSSTDAQRQQKLTIQKQKTADAVVQKDQQKNTHSSQSPQKKKNISPLPKNQEIREADSDLISKESPSKPPLLTNIKR